MQNAIKCAREIRNAIGSSPIVRGCHLTPYQRVIGKEPLKGHIYKLICLKIVL